MIFQGNLLWMSPISSLSNTVILRQLFIITVCGFQVTHSLYLAMFFSLLGKAVLASHPFQGSYIFIFSKEFSLRFSWSLHILVYTFFCLCSVFLCIHPVSSVESRVRLSSQLVCQLESPLCIESQPIQGCVFGDRFNVGLRNKRRHSFLQAFLTAIIFDNCIYLLLEIS